MTTKPSQDGGLTRRGLFGVAVGGAATAAGIGTAVAADSHQGIIMDRGNPNFGKRAVDKTLPHDRCTTLRFPDGHTESWRGADDARNPITGRRPGNTTHGRTRCSSDIGAPEVPVGSLEVTGAKIAPV